ncbi:MAG: response regulator [Steroidobacteraceae bacterium]
MIARAGAGESGCAPSDPPLVLHVEDDAALAAGLARLLELEGYRAVTAVDGPQALELIARQDLKPDVLIVDYNLPGGMDGTEVAEAIAAALGYVTPTIILSAELINAGMPWLPGTPMLPVSKPVAPDLLLKAVAVFAEFGRYARRRGSVLMTGC